MMMLPLLLLALLAVFLPDAPYGAAIDDTEPPTCSYCPADIIIKDATNSKVRVNWDRPTCADNSGVLPSITSNMRSGDFYKVPGSYEVRYRATDAANNTYDGCSFRITLKRKLCPLYAPPQNGALTCNKGGDDLMCMAMCKKGYDFVFNPPLLYYCASGEWNFYGLVHDMFPQPFEKRVPWPNCSATVNSASWLSTHRFPQFFFDGDANKPDVQDTLRDKFISIATSHLVPPPFCRFRPECNKGKVLVYPGHVTTK